MFKIVVIVCVFLCLCVIYQELMYVHVRVLYMKMNNAPYNPSRSNIRMPQHLSKRAN